MLQADWFRWGGDSKRPSTLAQIKLCYVNFPFFFFFFFCLMWGPRKNPFDRLHPLWFCSGKEPTIIWKYAFPLDQENMTTLPVHTGTHTLLARRTCFRQKKKVVFQNRCIFFYIPLQHIEMYRVFVKGRWIWREWGWKGYPLRRFPSIDVFKNETFLLESLSVQLNIFYPPFFLYLSWVSWVFF